LASSILQILLHILVSSYYPLIMPYILTWSLHSQCPRGSLVRCVRKLGPCLWSSVSNYLLPPSLSFHDLPLKVTIFMCHCVWYHHIIQKNSSKLVLSKLRTSFCTVGTIDLFMLSLTMARLVTVLLENDLDPHLSNITLGICYDQVEQILWCCW